MRVSVKRRTSVNEWERKKKEKVKEKENKGM